MVIGLVACTFVAVLLLTAMYVPLGRGLDQLDRPSGRSAHDRPVVSSGGVAVIGGLLLVLSTASALDLVAFSLRERSALMLIAVLCLVGFADDRRNLPVRFRLCVFFVISMVISALYLGTADLNKVGGWILLVTVGLALAWLVNLFNFMDGIDGIAALQCSLVAAGLATIGWLGGAPPSFLAAATAVSAAYAAFLGFNWPPARVFMGDAGSLSGGFYLGWLGLWAGVEGYIDPVVWLVLMSPFLLDTGYTLALRMLRGERVTQAHNKHVYQRLARRWKSHRRVDLALLALQLLWLLPLVIAMHVLALPGLVALALALLPQLILMAKTVAFE